MVFANACALDRKVAEDNPKLKEDTVANVDYLHNVLSDRLAIVQRGLAGNLAIDELWYGKEEATAIGTALVPRLSKARDKLV